MSVVRSSRFRHVFGKLMKRDNCYDNIRVSRSSLDSMACAVNPKFLAIIVEASGGGAFLVIPLTKYGRVGADQPLVDGHKGYITDIAFSPHDDNLVASASDDCTVKVWHIPDEGLTSPMSEPWSDLVYHQRRVNLILWHPTAQNVLLSAGADNRVAIWNVETGETLIQIDFHPDVVFSASWNWNGSKLVTTCKDKKIRIIDPRRGIVEEEAVCHEGTKATRAVFLRNGQIFTTGFSKMSEWQYSLREPGKLAEPLCLESNDSTNGIIFPLYDADTNLVYLCGKGDSLIRYYEITPEAPYVHPISLITTPEPQRGIGMMPKRGCDVRTCEVARFYRLTSSGHCQVISMNCPRKSELFQADLYPDTPSEEPALFADEWISGLDADPVLMSLRFGRTASGSTADVRDVEAKPRPSVAPRPSLRPALTVSPSDGSSSDEWTRSRSASNLSTLQIGKVSRKPRVRGTSLGDEDFVPGSASNLSTLEAGKVPRKPRVRGSSLGEEGDDGFLPRMRSDSSYSRVSDISDLNEEVASHEERLRTLEALLAKNESLPRVTGVVPKVDTPPPPPPLSNCPPMVGTEGDGYSRKQYAELKTIPKCNACDEIIFDEEYTYAEGKAFHVKHFTCFKCDKPLAGNEYFLIIERDLPMCFICYQERP